jgi:hypothetical protein
MANNNKAMAAVIICLIKMLQPMPTPVFTRLVSILAFKDRTPKYKAFNHTPD